MVVTVDFALVTRSACSCAKVKPIIILGLKSLLLDPGAWVKGHGQWTDIGPDIVRAAGPVFFFIIFGKAAGPVFKRETHTDLVCDIICTIWYNHIILCTHNWHYVIMSCYILVHTLICPWFSDHRLVLKFLRFFLKDKCVDSLIFFFLNVILVPKY